MLKGYTTRPAIENYLLITIDSGFYNQINEWIEEIESYIDKKTGRNFLADSTASARLYDGTNTRELLIDDCVAITELKIDADVIATDQYTLYPENAIVKGIPITKIKLIGSTFPKYPEQINSVKAKWGYSSAIPKDITTVATILVAGIINYSLNADGEVASETIGRYTVSYKDEKQWQDFERVGEILKYYRKFTF